MLEIPDNILEFFFQEIKFKGKYAIDIQNNIAYIIPREEERYYKPIIKITNLSNFANLLREYIEAVNEFNKRNNIELKEHQNLSYVLNVMLLNMTSSDALDLNKFLATRISFFYDQNLEQFTTPQKIFEYNNVSFYAQRETECFGLETPYIMTFSMNTSNKQYNLPIIRYGISSNNICFIYAVQIGRGRICNIDDIDYKYITNQVNQGAKEHRNISPSFVLILAIFLKILNDLGINQIIIPDFLFNRYKKYYHANSVIRSDEILTRMLHNITTLVNRMASQIDGFNIQSYPLDKDSYYHININNLDSKNSMLKKLLKKSDN